ncbi:ankyrin repeat-containing domain protein [Fusarium oxysporum]|nr:ankyrin repeat-containing domain protein [Fusarium oxysporum]
MNHGRIYFRAETVSRGADNIMSPQICVAGRPLTLTNFPPEIIKCIIDKILDENRVHKEESWEWDYWPEPEPEHNPLQVYVDALNLAATCKDIRRLVTKQIYIRDARDNHSAALLVSAKRNDIAGVIRALHIGANIHSDDATETVTYYTTGPNAIKTGHRVPLQLDNQVTAFHWAAFNGHKEIVSLLLNHGASINHRVSIDARLRCLGSPQAVDNQYRFMKLEKGANTLYFAVKGGNIDIAESLIKAGADLMTHTGTGLTALHQAVSNGDISMAKDLLMEGIDPNSADPFGKTPLHFIKCSEEEMAHPAVKMIQTLVEHGADINRWDLLGNTPLLTHLQDFERNDSVIADAMAYIGFVGPGCEPVPLPPNHDTGMEWSETREAIF